MKLNFINVFKVLECLLGDRLIYEFIEIIFKKLDKVYFYRYFKNVYFVVCLNGFLYFVFKFNELGCKNLIDVLFVESLIIRSFFNVIEKN